MLEPILVVPVKVSNGTESPTVYFEATQLDSIEADSSEVDVSRNNFDLDELCETIGIVAKALGSRLEQLKAKRTVIEFGVEVAAESGHLTALIVKGTGKANLKVTVEWG
jgi:hypothetical protein